MSELDGKMKRLQEARKKAEEVARRRQRIAGELDGHLKRLTELEKKCKDDYDCKVEELPALSARLEKEADKAIVEAERLLTVPAASPEPANPAIAPAPAEPAKGPVRRSPLSRAKNDEDVL